MKQGATGSYADTALPVQVRSNLQRAIGRPLALDEASAMTIGDIKALEAGGEGGSESKQEKAAATPQDEETAASVQPKSAPIILPSKIIDLKKDLCVRKEVAGRFVKDYTVKPIKEDRTDSPPSAPSTPDKVDPHSCLFRATQLVPSVPLFGLGLPLIILPHF